MNIWDLDIKALVFCKNNGILYVNELGPTTALIHVDNSRFAITAINSKLELKSTIKTNSFTLTIGCSMIFEIVANLVS